MTIVVTDSTPTGQETARLLLAEVPSPITLRELIRLRVREEAARRNAGPTIPYPSLVEPTPAEIALNGPRRVRRIDWEAAAEVALKAFARNGFFVFVGDRQIEDLDASLTLVEAQEISFVRLVPLVGG